MVSGLPVLLLFSPLSLAPLGTLCDGMVFALTWAIIIWLWNVEMLDVFVTYFDFFTQLWPFGCPSEIGSSSFKASINIFDGFYFKDSGQCLHRAVFPSCAESVFWCVYFIRWTKSTGSFESIEHLASSRVPKDLVCSTCCNFRSDWCIRSQCPKGTYFLLSLIHSFILCVSLFYIPSLLLDDSSAFVVFKRFSMHLPHLYSIFKCENKCELRSQRDTAELRFKLVQIGSQSEIVVGLVHALRILGMTGYILKSWIFM